MQKSNEKQIFTLKEILSRNRDSISVEDTKTFAEIIAQLEKMNKNNQISKENLVIIICNILKFITDNDLINSLFE